GMSHVMPWIVSKISMVTLISIPSRISCSKTKTRQNPYLKCNIHTPKQGSKSQQMRLRLLCRHVDQEPYTMVLQPLNWEIALLHGQHCDLLIIYSTQCSAAIAKTVDWLSTWRGNTTVFLSEVLQPFHGWHQNFGRLICLIQLTAT